MSLKDPAILGIYSNRSVERLGDSLRRVSVLERRPPGAGGGGTLGGSILSGPVSAATSVTTGTPQWAGLGLGVAATSGVSLTISQPTMTNRILDDVAGGSSDWTSTAEATRYEIRQGQFGSRYTTSAPTMRLVAYREQTNTISDHQDPNTYSTFLVMARGGTGHSVALQAGAFHTQNLSTVTPDYVTTNTDSQAVSGIGEVATGGKGRAIGGFFYSWIDADADPLAKGSGIEAVVENRIVSNDHSVVISGTGGGSPSMCAFIVAKGPSRVAAGIQLAADVTGSFECGFYAPFRSSGTIIEEATYRDYGQAEHSLDIGGVHTKAAIGIGATSGGIVIGRGSKTAFAALDLGWDSDGVTPATTYAGGILFGNDTQLYRATTNTLRFDASGGASARVGFGATNVPDTAAGGMTSVFIAPGRVDVARATSGQVFRAFNSVGTTNEKPFFQVDVVGPTIKMGLGGTSAVDCDLGRYDVGILRSDTTGLGVTNLWLSLPTGQIATANRFECRVGSQAAPSTDPTLRSGAIEHFFGDMTALSWGAQGGWTNTWEWKNATADHGDNMLGVRSTVNYGGSNSPVAAKGASHAFTADVVVHGAGINAANGLPGEQAPFYGAVEDRTINAEQSGRLWGIDLKLHGSQSSVINHSLKGYVCLINQYQSAEPLGGPSAGLQISTSSDATNSGSGFHSGATTYPLDYAIQLTGVTGTPANHTTSSATQGFKVGIGVGEGLAAWSDYSRLGTGIRVNNYEDYGIRIWKRWAGSTGPSLSVGWDSAGSASTAAADGIDFGGDTNLYRGAASVLKTDDAIGITQSAVPTTTTSGTGFFLGATGIMEQMRNTTGTFWRVYGNSADVLATPTMRMRVLAAGVIQEYSAAGGNVLDTTFARTAAGQFHIVSNLSVATGILGGGTGAPSTGLDTATSLATRRAVLTALTTGNNNDVAVTTSYVAVTGTTAGIIITGITSSSINGRRLVIRNQSTQNIQLNHQDGNSAVANRFQMKDAANQTVAPLAVMEFLWDSAQGWWIELSRNL